MNSVKLYSSGTAVVAREYPFNGEEILNVSIPVKKDDLDEVVSSISVFGDVSLPEPPSYTPTNSPSELLSFDGSSVLKDMAVKLRGAQVSVAIPGNKTLAGTLYGIQKYQQETNGSVFDRYRLLVKTADGIRQIEESDIVSLSFTDESVQEKIDKAMQASFDQIKPDSRNINLAIQKNGKADSATIAYATSCAAWKIRYQLRLIGEKAYLEGQAIVDNDTDDDWKNVMLSVITGEPISFSTDIAEIRRPRRNRVNVVSDTTQGAVTAAESMPAQRTMMKASFAGNAPRMAAPAGGTYACSLNDEAAVLESCNNISVAQPEALVKESGDFSIYSSANPVTIMSKKSAIINLFSHPLENTKTVLFYKADRHQTRAYRAIKFTNTTPNSLGKGVCEIYVDGDRQGKCVVESTPKNVESCLIHALETGVKILRQTKALETIRVGLRFSEGFAYAEDRYSYETTYRIQNDKAEAFDFDIEHTKMWGNESTLEVVCESQTTSVDIANGQRISTSLAANAYLEVTVREIRINRSQVVLNTNWLQYNVIDMQNPLSNKPEILNIIALQEALDKIVQDIETAEEESETLREEQKRLSELIKSVRTDEADQFRTEVFEAEKALKTLKKTTLPELRKNQKAAEAAVQNALKALKLQYTTQSEVAQVDSK